ncbi:hypothetical protein, partial [Xanthomonas phaseoli]|uniref:hypothetical protein n=1 Tax=Xanthomonas phaseoli TaxID=1985254 RepID=UPI001FD07443
MNGTIGWATAGMRDAAHIAMSRCRCQAMAVTSGAASGKARHCLDVRRESLALASADDGFDQIFGAHLREVLDWTLRFRGTQKNG